MTEPKTHPVNYTSVRVTVNHDQWNVLLPAIADQQWLAWPHFGKDKNNQHFHIIVIGELRLDALRKRFKTLFNKTGNGFIRCKQESNGVLSAITYCAKEGTSAMHSLPEHADWIKDAPVWVNEDRNIGGYLNKKAPRELHEDHHRELTYRNLEKATLRYRQREGIKSINLEDTLAHMHKHNWRLNIALTRGGIPSQFFDQFTAACNGKSVYTSGRFLMMRCVEQWRHN